MQACGSERYGNFLVELYFGGERYQVEGWMKNDTRCGYGRRKTSGGNVKA